MIFPTMWHFDMCRLRWGSAASDQTVRMRRLIWGFAGRTYHIVGNRMHWLIYITYLKVKIMNTEHDQKGIYNIYQGRATLNEDCLAHSVVCHAYPSKTKYIANVWFFPSCWLIVSALVPSPLAIWNIFGHGRWLQCHNRVMKSSL